MLLKQEWKAYIAYRKEERIHESRRLADRKAAGLNTDSDVYGAFHKRVEAGLEIPTYGQWKLIRSQGAQGRPTKIVEINGVRHKEEWFNGTKLLMVV